jgi:Zn-dependent protease
MVFNLLPIPPLDGSHVAARLLGVRDPYLVDRLAPMGFVVLFLFIVTGLFGAVFEVTVVPLARLFLP